MVMSCSVIGCFNKTAKGSGITFHRFPVDKNRKALWIRAIKRKDWEPHRQSSVCSKHFQTGKPSKDINDPDFVPNLFHCSTPTKKVRRRRKKCEETERASPDLQAVTTSHPQNSSSSGQPNKNISNPAFGPIAYSYSNGKFIALQEENKKLKSEVEELKRQLQESTISSTLEMHLLKNDVEVLKKKLKFADFPSRVLADTNKICMYTGVPTRDGFDWILSISKKYVTRSFSIPDEHQLLIVLIKLRMALCDEDIAIRFSVSRRTVRRVLGAWLPVLSSRLNHLIAWPKRKKIQKKLPSCFKFSAFKDTMCIVDCTEIKTQRPSNMKTRCQMWSNYKQHLTVKFLVGITPQGHICFVSKGHGGRSTDKEIALKSNLLNNLLPGDMVLADRGFNIASDLSIHGIRVIVPAFTKGQKQLPGVEVIRSKRISNVRIHVERVIGYMKRFKILTETLPVTSLKYVDCFIKISAALHNLWPGTVH